MIKELPNYDQVKAVVPSKGDADDCEKKSPAPPASVNQEISINKFSHDSTTNAGFGQLPPEQFDAEYLRLIKSDIANARAHRHEMPAEAKRGLSDETIDHFGFGYLEDWILTKPRAQWNCGTYLDKNGKPKKSLPPPSRRIIIPTDDGEHFNAVALPSDRKRMKKDFWKQHAGKKTRFFGDKKSVADADIVVVVEGEFDAASIWQCSDGKIAAVAILGCSNANNTLMPYLKSLLSGKKLLLLLDGDKSGRSESEKLRAELIKQAVPTASRYLTDFNSFAEGTKQLGDKVDCNDILRKHGNEFLKSLLDRIIDDARADLSEAEKKIREQSLFEPASTDNDNSEEQDTGTTTAPPPVTTETISTARAALKVIPAAQCTEKDWLTVIWAGKASGLTLSELDTWSRPDTRYDAVRVANNFNRYDPAKKNKDGKRLTVASLINIARKFNPEFKSPKKPAADPLADLNISDEIKAEIKNWEADNGKINPELLTKIIAAKKFLDDFTPETITAGIAQSRNIKRAVAICEVYDIDGIAESAANFRAKLDIARKRAAAQIKATNDPKKISVEAQALKTLSMTNWNKAIDDEAAKLKRARKKYLQMEAIRAEQEAAKKGREKRAAARQSDIEKLDELRKEAQTTARDAEIVSRINSACDWKLDRHGEPVEVKDTAANAELIFGNDPNIDGAIGFDEFQQADVILKKLPWHNSDQSVGELFKNRDGAELRFYLRKNYSEFGKNAQSIDDALIRFSNQHRFHPVKEFFWNLPEWDGTPRAEELFIKFLRVDDNDFTREVTLKWLIAAVARIFHPGCDYQYALVLHGKQGVGKGFILRRLGGKWYGAIADSVDDSHAIDAIQNLWLAEFKELQGLSKASVNAIKAFVDEREDNRRPPYGRRTEKTKRHVVFAITTNDDQFLSDVTGNRRFMILECHNEPGNYVEGLTDDYIAQVWAEVKIKFKELFTDETGHYHFDEKKLELSKAAKIRVEEIASKHMRDDELANEVKAYLENPIPPQIIWQLLSRDDRRKFCADRQIYIAGGVTELEFKRRTNGGSKAKLEADLKEIFDMFSTRNENKFFREVSTGGNDKALVIYGFERRQHVSAGEIRNEAFPANDKRVSMKRIWEILQTLDGWKLGNRIQNDTAYKDQKKVYWREEEPEETSPEQNPEPTNEQNPAQSSTNNENETSQTDFINTEPVTDDLPF